MKTQKRIIGTIAALFGFFFVLTLLYAQTNIVAPPPEIVVEENPKGPDVTKTISFWQMLIPIVVPALIAALRGIVPNLPKSMVPWLAPIIGAAIDIILNLTGLGTGVGPVGATLGATGTWVYEVSKPVTSRLTGKSG